MAPQGENEMTLSIGTLFTLIIILLALGLLVWLAFYVLRRFPLPDPFGRIAEVVIVVVAVLILVVFLLSLAGIGPGIRISATSSLIESLRS
jgi:hypothetical protein